jgi:creatinine amidohydrolase
MNTRLLAELTWPEVGEAIARGAGVVLPVGATEQHGPHLPLSTDAIFARELALAVAEPLDLLVAPTIAYGYRSRPLSGGGQGFVGTTSVSGSTLMGLVEDVLRELIRHGFRRLVLLNWHFENQGFLYEAAYRAREPHSEDRGRIMVMEAPFENLSEQTIEALFPDGFPGWATEHASIIETSLMLHLHPELVRFDRAVDDKAERSPWYDVIPTPSEFVPASGTLWKATQGSADKGHRAWPEIIAQASDAIAQELPAEKIRG